MNNKFIPFKRVQDKPMEIAIDWDGVIQNIELKWIYKIYQEKDKEKREFLNKYFTFYESFTDNISQNVAILINRDTYYLTDFFKRYKDESFNDMYKMFYDDVYTYYMDDEEFYNDIPVNFIMQNIFAILQDDICRNVIILTHELNGDKRKEKFFNEKILPLIPSHLKNKISYNGVPSGIPKSSFIKNNYPNTNLLIDDAPKVINDYLENLENCVLIIPNYGFNRPLLNKYFNGEDKEFLNNLRNKNIDIVGLDAYENQNQRIKL